MENSNLRKGASIASLVLGALGWLGQKFDWFFVKATDAISFDQLVVDRSTTGANPVDWVATGRTERQARGLGRTPWTGLITLPR